MGFAENASLRSTCSRLSVGAVLVRDARVVASGYNGAASGWTHCGDPHPEGPCTRAIHAEHNVLLMAARHGIRTEGAEMFVTHAPCLGCSGFIVQAGVTKVFFREEYRDMSGVDALVRSGVGVSRI